MGIDLENFDYNVSQEYICPSCRKVLQLPLVTACSHILCTKCFNKRLKKRLKCPVCGCSMGNGGKHFDSSWLKRYETLKMNCTKGCEMAVTVGGLEHHLTHECPITFAHCSNTGCSKKVRRRDLPQHLSLCDYRVLDCENCGFRTQFVNLRTHQLAKKCGVKKNLHMIVQSRRELNAIVKQHKRQVDQDTFRRTLNEREMEKSKMWSAIHQNDPNRIRSRSSSPTWKEEERASMSLSRLSTYSGRLRSSRISASPDTALLCMNCKKLFVEDTNHDQACQWHEGPIVDVFGGMCQLCGKLDNLEGCVRGFHVPIPEQLQHSKTSRKSTTSAAFLTS